MNRSDLQQLAELRLREAETLLNNSFYAGSYYLAGYAVECALKARIAQQVNQYDFPDKKLAYDSHTHNLAQLVGAAQLKSELDTELSSNPTFNVNWNTVIQWKEDSRYNANITQVLATNLYAAITDQPNGVLTWLKKFW